jgi:hypothetical protein
MPLDIRKLGYHVATRDIAGNPVLMPKAKPAELASASIVSRRSYDLASQREAESVHAAAKDAIAAVKPAGFDTWSAVTKRAWNLAVQRGETR